VRYRKLANQTPALPSSGQKTSKMAPRTFIGRCCIFVYKIVEGIRTKQFFHNFLFTIYFLHGSHSKLDYKNGCRCRRRAVARLYAVTYLLAGVIFGATGTHYALRSPGSEAALPAVSATGCLPALKNRRHFLHQLIVHSLMANSRRRKTLDCSHAWRHTSRQVPASRRTFRQHL